MMSAAYWDCTDITRWRRLCMKWDCIQKVSWFSGINALQRNQKVSIYFYVWTTNGTICSALGVQFFKSKSSNNPLKAGANDKVGLWIGAAVIWNQRQLFWERKQLTGGWTRQVIAKGWPWGKVPATTCMRFTSGITVLKWNFIIKILQDMYVKIR